MNWWDGYPVCDECGHILMSEADESRCSICGAYGRTYRRRVAPDVVRLTERIRDALALPPAHTIQYVDAERRFMVEATYWWPERSDPAGVPTFTERSATVEGWVTREVVERGDGDLAMLARWWERQKRSAGVPIPSAAT